MEEQEDRSNKLLAEIEKAFSLDFTFWYCKVLNIGIGDVERVKTVKPQAFREMLMLLEPFADRLLEEDSVVRKLRKWFKEYRQKWIDCPSHLNCEKCRTRNDCEFQEVAKEFYKILTGLENKETTS